jgi:hypothetical protein
MRTLRSCHVKASCRAGTSALPSHKVWRPQTVRHAQAHRTGCQKHSAASTEVVQAATQTVAHLHRLKHIQITRRARPAQLGEDPRTSRHPVLLGEHDACAHFEMTYRSTRRTLRDSARVR